MHMQKITPFLWFNKNVDEATSFYVSIFQNAKVDSMTRYGDQEAGTPGTVIETTFSIAGEKFYALSGGLLFSFSPAISFYVSCDTDEELTELWTKLCIQGEVMMELGKYPFGEKYGWVQDKFGVSWQLNLMPHSQKITPFLMFVGEHQGQAREAIEFYCSLFHDSRIIKMQTYGKGEQEPEGRVQHAVFALGGYELMALDSGLGHAFTFTPAISFFVSCQTQEEVDWFWEKLSEGGEKEMCGWLKDKYGISWQIIPTILGELMQDRNPVKAKRVMDVMLQMRKIEIEKLKQAYSEA